MKEKNLYICAAECIIEKDSRYLVIERPHGVHAGGLFAFPGGKLEPLDGEHQHDIFVAAAKREVF